MAMNVGERRDGEPVSEINTTPLIDVMLVLLIMLIVTLPPQRQIVKLDTPLPCKTCPQVLDQPVRISVDYDGAVKWNGQAVSFAQLDQLLAREAARNPQPEIHIEPDRLASYGVVAHVMAAAQREGLKRLGVVGGA